MPVTVYVWLSEGSGPKKRVGHGSIELSNGVYISWWPAGGKGAKPKVTGTPERTLEEDTEEEGGEPDYILQIPQSIKLNEDAMHSWWDTFKNEGTWNLKTNCCWVVEEALIKGGIEKYLQVRSSIHFISHPKQLLALLKKIEAVNCRSGRALRATSAVYNERELLDALTRLLGGETDENVLSVITFQ